MKPQTLRRLAEDARKNKRWPTRHLLADALDGAAATIERLKKAAGERVRWLDTGSQLMALVGKDVFRLVRFGVGPMALFHRSSLPRQQVQWIGLGGVRSQEAAARRIRAYRSGKWKPAPLVNLNDVWRQGVLRTTEVRVVEFSPDGKTAALRLVHHDKPTIHRPLAWFAKMRLVERDGKAV